jgi:hypothetical protein
MPKMLGRRTRAKHELQVRSMIREGNPRASKEKHDPRWQSTSGNGKAIAPMAKQVPQRLSMTFHGKARPGMSRDRAAQALDADTYMGEGWGMSCYTCMPDNQNIGLFTATRCASQFFNRELEGTFCVPCPRSDSGNSLQHIRGGGEGDDSDANDELESRTPGEFVMECVHFLIQ